MNWSAPWITVEVGYGSTWQTEPGDITWVEETGRVLVGEGVSVRRGASSARGKVDVGTAEFVLSNIDRRFDPTHAGGDLSGDLKPGTPVRVLAWPVDQLVTDGGLVVLDGGLPVTDGTPVVIWSGTIPSWPQRYDRSNRHAWCPISAYDRFDKLSRAKIPRSVLEAEILADSPVAYWALDEASGSVMVDRSGNNHDGTYFNTELASEEAAVGAGRAAFFEANEGARGLVKSAPVVDDYPFTIEATIKFDELAAQDGMVIVWHSLDASLMNRGSLYVVGSTVPTYFGRLVFFLTIDDASAGLVVGESALEAGEPHHLAVVCNSSTDWELWVDGEEETLSVLVAVNAPWPDWTMWSIGGSVPTAKGAWGLGGSANSVAIHDVAASGATLAAHASAALTPLDGQTTGERATWILDEIVWPPGFRDISTGRSILGPATFKPGDGALEYLRLIEATEDGRLFIGPDGSVVFHDRYWRYLETVATVSQFTFTDQDGDQGYAEFQLDLDDELLVNVARFTRRDGTEQVSSDPASVATYGQAEEVRSNLLSTTDAQVRSLAEWAVSTKSTPLPRVPSIRIPLHRYSAADQATVLGLDLGHRVTVTRTPQGVGAEINLDFLVEGMSHDIGFNEWWVNLFVSPVPQDTAELFLLGSSELGGTHILAH